MDPRPRTPLLAAVPAALAESVLTPRPRSGPDESADQIDHAVDVSIGDVGEQRQRDLLLVVVLGDRTHATLVAQIGVDGMPVDGDVVDLDADLVRFEVLEERAPATVADPQRVEVPHGVLSLIHISEPTRLGMISYA